MKKILLFFLGIIFLLLLIISFNTLRFNSKQSGSLGERRKFATDTSAIRHLSDIIRIRTISYDQDSLTTYSTFDSLIAYFHRNYPLVFSKLDEQVINDHSLLLHWKGNSSAKKPVILYAHLDVVPADESGTSNWHFPPFDGIVDADFIYGRGVIDDKGSVIGILESVERLISNNYSPSRDIYIAFGHDEEAGGEKGARFIAEALKKLNVKAEFLLDEGGLVAIDMVPFVRSPVALIFTSEKGYMTLKLKVKGNGGHSSFPPADAPIELLSQAIQNIHDHPFEKRMTESVSDFMEYTGPEMRMPFKALFGNRWLFNPVIFNEYEKIPSASAMIRTTSVTTIIQGGVKENVIPSEVSATMNFRLLPGDKSKDIIKKIKDIINNDKVEISTVGAIEEASVVASVKSEGFNLITKTIGSVFPDAIVAPSLMIAQTDSRHFRDVTDNIYRFLPVRMDSKILDTFHGTDEKINIHDFMETVSFYETLISGL